MKKILIIILFFFCIQAVAQVDYATRFNNGKSLFNDKKYNLAMETLKPLMTYDRNNVYTEYASFYYAASAYHQGYKSVAKLTFNQIKTLYPSWDKMNEVNYWMAKIHFEEQDYFQALKVLAGITDKKFEADIQTVKESGLRSVADPETLRMMLEEYPKDAAVAKALASVLAKNLSDEEGKKQLEELIENFKLTRTDFIPEAPKTFFKEKYAVALMMPFMVGSLEPTPGRKRTQIMLDFYEGAKLAIDTLSKQNIQISLRAYDTERNVDKINRYLETEEIKNTDLIIGPLFPEENKAVQDFTAEYRINVIHPFSNLTETIGMNPHAYLFQPSAETLGRKSADFLDSKLKPRDKDCMIFYGPGKKDSVLALSFQQRAVELGIKVLTSLKVTNTKTNVITEILASPTEFDEFKYPSQFTSAEGQPSQHLCRIR
jgi:tetratricopeptide (TPR) repeat protein